MGGQNHLQCRKGSLKQTNNKLLPSRMEMHVHLINEKDARCSQGRVVAQVWIEDRAPTCNVHDECNGIAHAIAKCRQREAAVVWMLDNKRVSLEVPFEVTPLGRFKHNPHGFLHGSKQTQIRG